MKSFFTRHRVLTITLFLFLVILPFILIPTVYIYQIASSKPILFHDKKNKAIKLKDQNYFNINFVLFDIIDPDKDNANGYYIFNYEIEVKPELVNELTDITFQVLLVVGNDKYITYSLGPHSQLKSTSSSRLKVEFNYDMDKSILPFLKPKGPKLYMQIQFYERFSQFNNEEHRDFIIEIPY